MYIPWWGNSPGIYIIASAPGVDSTFQSTPTTQTLDGSNDALACHLIAPNTDSIAKICFWQADVDGTDTSLQWDVGVQGVQTGNPPTPDGTFKTNGGSCKGTYTHPGTATSADSLKIVTLDNNYPMTKNEDLALVIQYASGTISSSNDQTVYTGLQSGMSYTGGPVCWVKTGINWSTPATGDFPCMGIETDTGDRYGWWLGSLDNTLNTGATAYQGLRFLIPGTGTIKLHGAIWSTDTQSSTYNQIEMDLRSDPDGTDTQEGNVTYSGWWYSDSTGYYGVPSYFDSPITINLGQEYYLGMRPIGGVARINYWTFDDATYRYCVPACRAAGNQSWYWAQRTAAGTYTNTTTRLPIVSLIVEPVTGGGGSSSKFSSHNRIIGAGNVF